jgi:uncharacterized protein YegP (UPF0339 family)
MATATKRARARVVPRVSGAPESSTMEFLIFEDNGGGHHWTIVDGAGESLVRSARFASYDEAERAARLVRDNAGSARLERRAAGGRPVDLTARRDAASGDNSDAERWLDEGGSFSSEAVAQWPAPR